MARVKAKVLKYQKEINFNIILEFKRSSNPGKGIAKAARSLCLLLVCFKNSYTGISDPLFKDWTASRAFLSENSHQILADISRANYLCEEGVFNITKVRYLMREVFMQSEASEMASPRIHN